MQGITKRVKSNESAITDKHAELQMKVLLPRWPTVQGIAIAYMHRSLHIKHIPHIEYVVTYIIGSCSCILIGLNWELVHQECE